MKKVIVLVVAMMLALTVVLTGCGSQSTADTDASDTQVSTEPSVDVSESDQVNDADKIVIGYAVHNFTNPYYYGIMDGGDIAAEELGCEVIWKSCEASIESEISIIENFIEQGVSAICMDPVDAEALKDVINRATEAGIPVVTFNNIIDGVEAYAYTPNSEASATNLAEAMCAYLNYEGKVAILQEQPGNFSSDTHEQAYRDVIAKYPNIEIVGEQITDWDPDKALQITQTWLSTLDELDAIITISGNSAAAAAQAIEAAGKTGEIATFSVDSMNNELVSEGSQVGDSASYTLYVGYWNIKMCYDLTKDLDSWPKVTHYTPYFCATQENYDKMVANGLLEQVPDLSFMSVDEAMEVLDSGDPTTVTPKWDEGFGPRDY